MSAPHPEKTQKTAVQPNNRPVVIITGGASGIGEACAKDFAANGIIPVIVDINRAQGERVAYAFNGLYVHADLCLSEDCAAVVDQVMSHYGRIDILINNAGLQTVAPIEEFPEDRWQIMMALMLTAPFLLTKHVWPHMKNQQMGRIVNVGSIHSLVASPYKSAYITAKHGLIGLTKASALEGGEHGITVNAVCPGYVRTPLVEGQLADQAKNLGISEDEVLHKVMLKPAAIKRLIEPSEVAQMVRFLCSKEAGAVTGSTWTMDLGWTAQ